jgi:O-antigen/teichoic acid export membrane protein
MTARHQQRTLGHTLVSNAAANLGGQGLLLLLTFFSTPYVTRHFGPSLYGVLVLLVTYVETFNLLNLGIYTGLLKYVSELLPQGKMDEVERYFGSGFTLFGGGGILIGVIGAVCARPIVYHLMNIPIALRPEVVLAFHIATAAFVLRFLAQPFAAMPFAVQRFDVAAAISVGGEAVRIAVWVLMIFLGHYLIAALLVTLGVNAASLAANVLATRWLIPGISLRPRWSPAHARSVFHYSKYVLVGQVTGRVVNSADVGILGKFQPVSAVAFYGIPYTIGYKMWTLMGNVASVVFPAASALSGAGQTAQLRELYCRATKLVAGMGILIASVLVVYGREVLLYWLGPVFAVHGAIAFRLLIAAFWLNSLQHVPYAVLQSTGRVQLTARFAVVYAIGNVFMFFLLIPRFGVNGAAGGFLITQMLTIPWLIHTCNSCVAVKGTTVFVRAWVRVLIVTGFSGLFAFVLKPWISSLLTLMCAIAAVLLASAAVALVLILDKPERAACWSVLKQWIPLFGRPQEPSLPQMDTDER